MLRDVDHYMKGTMQQCVQRIVQESWFQNKLLLVHYLFATTVASCHSLSSNGNLNLDTRLDVDDDSLDDLSRRVQVDQALVNAHLKCVPSLAALTTRCLSGRDL